MTMGRDGIRCWAWAVIHDARDNEWQRMDRECMAANDCGDYARAEDLLHQMSERFEANIARLIGTYPECDREALGVEVNERLMALAK